MSPSEEIYKKDLKLIATLQEKNWKALARALKAMGPLQEEARLAFPGKDKDSIRRRKTALLNLVRSSAFAKAALKEIQVLPEDQAKVIGLMRDSLAGDRKLKDTRARLDLYGRNRYIKDTLGVGQAPLQVLPEELRKFLPDNIWVEVDPEGVIRKVTDRFVNQKETWEWKIQRIKLILEKREEILRRMREDLRSGDPELSTKALIASILYQTGIRPGYEGNQSTVVLPNGEKVLETTFGATTLKAEHVKFLRNNLAELQFIGKAGTLNTATLSDPVLVSVLKSYQESNTQGFLFTTKSGSVFGQKDLDAYFKSRFFGISPKDFRRLKASEKMLEALNAENEKLREQIRGFVKTEKAELASRITEKLAEAISNAMDAAAETLSHASGKDVTRTNYINPQIVLDFLSRGKPARTLEQAVLSNQIALRFDPANFVPELTKAASEFLMTLGDLLNQTEGEIRDFSFGLA